MNDALREIFTAVADGTLTEDQALRLVEGLSRPAAEVPGAPYPLSRGQAALWAIHEAVPTTAAYNLPLVLRMRADADPGLLQRAFSAVVERHPGLRINVRTEDGDPVQVITDRGVQVEELDFGHLTEQELGNRVHGLIQEPFDLAHDPLYRVHFVRTGGAGPLLVLVFHHLITDGVSSHLLLRDLVACYEGLARTGELPATEPATPYHEFVRWQQEMLAGPDGERHARFWAAKLAGASSAPVLDRLVDHRRSGPPSHVGRSVQLELGEREWAAVRELAAARQVSAFCVVFGAFAGLLHRHTGQQDICVSVPTDGRAQQRFERTMGYLINPVVLRTACTPELTGAALFQAVREELLAAEDHADYPFARVVEDLRRDGAGDPAFTIGCYLQQGVGSDLDVVADQTLLTEALPHTQLGEADLVLEVVVQRGRAQLHLKYDPELFERSTVERLAEHYRVLLAELVAHPERELGQVELATPGERELLRRLNDTAVQHFDERTAVDLVLAQAARTPDVVAIVDTSGELSYAELASQVESLAARLRGAGPLVGIMLERRAELVVAMLAVHRAGHAYVPLDPEFPAERLDFIAADAAISIVITDAASVDRLPGAGIEPILVDGSEPAGAGAGPAPDEAGELAYVLYTSGSTGKPKGVEVGHRSLVNFLRSMARRPGCAAGDRLLAVTTVSFDIAALELLLPLTCGATVQIAPAEVVRDGVRLAELLITSAATMVQATPATWQMLLAAGWHGRFAGRILCGGEALAPELAEQLLARASEVWNMYGPTETTIWSSVRQVRRNRPISVGTPIANTCFHVLDEGGRPVPYGARGELCIGGHGVARGYRGRPELTAEKFVADPQHGGRMFRTGDAARMLPDGSVEVLGRLDRQLKVRGYRIELGEVEAVLRRSEPVVEARVVVREDSPGHQGLVAFAQVPEAGPDLAGELAGHLAAWLPGYMIPSRTVPLRAFPETPNAKIDVEALTRLSIDDIVARFGHGGASEPVAAREPEATGPEPSLLARLRELVAEVVGVTAAEIATDQPLGDHGFDSIRFTRLSALLRDRLALAVPTTAFYGYPTLDALAAHLRGAFPESTARSAPKPVAPPNAGNEAYPPVAIIGIGGRLPESDTLDEFWEHLAAGRDLVRPYPVERGFSRNLFGRYPHEFRGSFVRDVEGFDAALLRISPREATQMDPQHRLLLHAAREAVEDAGYAASALAGSGTGVFVGLSGSDYFSLLGHERETDDHFLIGNLASIASNRVSYLFDFHGPSATYDTACSSSLVAIHRAARAIQRGDCEQALAGGANLLLSPYAFLGLTRAGMLSPDGRCKTFDERADGYGRGEGVVLLMLKRLDRARADGDPVHGVIIGSAENHGGRTHSLTVPNPRAQTEVVVRAHEAAAVPPATIGYLEAHGTGTRLGDPIEVNGLKDAFARLAAKWGGDAGQPRIALGSVKTNIGHLESAAGVAGVVKVLLAMKHRTLPGLVHLRRPNPEIDLDGSPFVLQQATAAWEERCDERGAPLPRRAGVSSFGMGGSNVHVVLEEAEER
ncbi:amino acid adenylation domain-containing protein [Saccharopolyspora sp. NPDC000359]|uniref:amino acid adenylation domain-containing protein n=1 Tax=Saccharopolyspora sp. NPDC000359 TaxID=3154251 RepID=UPI0033266906